MSLRTYSRSLLLLAAGIAASQIGLAQRTYQLKRLDPPNAGSATQALAINSAGLVLVCTGDGSAFGDAWVLAGPAPRHLAPLAGDPLSRPLRLTDTGRAFGSSGTSTQACRPVVWSATGTPHELRRPSGESAGYAFDGNGEGWIVGQTGSLLGGSCQPVAWNRGVLVTLDLPPGLEFGYLRSINQRGTMVGTASAGSLAGWVRDGLAAPQAIPLYPGHGQNGLDDINSRGLAVGWSYDAVTGTGFALFYDTVTASQELVPPPGGFNWVEASFVNRAGHALGVTLNPTSPFHPVLIENGTAFVLQDLLDSSGAGWTLTAPAGINDAGQIACTGLDEQGRLSACLLNPVAKTP